MHTNAYKGGRLSEHDQKFQMRTVCNKGGRGGVRKIMGKCVCN